MAVRVRVEIGCTSTQKTLKTIALVNTAFESKRTQLLLPIGAAKRLGLWPNLPPTTRTEVYGTAGGAARKYLVPNAIEVKVIARNVESPTFGSDAVVSDIEDEVFVNDKLSGELGIVIEEIGKGWWRLKADPKKRLMKSKRPQYW